MSEDLTRELRRDPASQERWTKWYKTMYPRLYHAAYRLTGGDTDAARDLTQESFMRFLKYDASKRVESDGHAIGYLITTCRNLASNRAAHPVETTLPEDLEAPSANELSAELDRLMETLPDEDRQLLQWARMGVSLTEIATRMGITYSSAGVRLHRLKRQLRELSRREL